MRGPVGVGVGWRAELALDLLRSPGSADFVEVVAETCFVQPEARREARAIAEVWPVIPHGVKLSLGSAEGIDPDRARALGALAKALRAPIVSEHVAFVRSGDREIGHLTALPPTRAALSVVERNVARARRYLPDVPLLLENVAWTFRWPDSEMDEGSFYSEVVRRTGCQLLLDVGNLYANAVNSGLEPAEVAQTFPLNSVGMIHLAGGVLEHGFYFDDHAHAVSGSVFELLESVLAVTGAVPILIERDALFPPFAELAGEVERGRRLLANAGAKAASPARAPERPPELERVDTTGLGRDQGAIARLLTDVAAPNADACARFGREALERSRAVLQRKRVDEALPLLPHLCRSRPAVEPLARRVVESTERLPKMAAIADAIAIAEQALANEALAPLAERDALALSARFVRQGQRVLPRRAPLVSYKTLSGGNRVLALKGFGTRARVHFYERNSTRHE